MGNNKTYISTFITGFAELIPHSIKNEFNTKHFDIESIYDGLIVYNTDAAIKDVIKTPFFNNTFLHMADIPYTRDIKHILHALNTEFNFHMGLDVRLPKNIRTFRLVISDENKTINPHPNYKSYVESKIAKQLKLRVDPNKPDTEFWIIIRSEGVAFLGMRLTKHPDYATSMPKGALRPELAYLIASLVPVVKDGSVLDPFAGSGSIAEACALRGWKHVIASDFNQKTVQRLRGRIRKYKQIKVSQADALILEDIHSDSVDAIVTNPPWNHHFSMDLDTFYPKFFQAAYRVLKPQQPLILLVENTKQSHKLINQAKGFEKVEVFDTLVSGRKAQVWHLIKN